MISRYLHLQEPASDNRHLHRAQLFRLHGDREEREALQALLDSGAVRNIHDTLADQLRELAKIRNASRRLTPLESAAAVDEYLHGTPIEEYGVWTFYPWSGRLVHLLDEAAFTELRTNRNKYKITGEEQELLSHKRVGVIGLSVGQSVALTMAMERSFGELRLADFDTLELSNLNRIRSGVHEIGDLKVINAAREIAEIDPFLKVTVFADGLTRDNLDAFFTEGGQLDALIEECDNLEMKLLSRVKAHELRIPVLMDTSDRGMIDIERFDIEPERPILHGLAEGIDPAGLGTLSMEEKIPVLMRMVGSETLSLRMKASMLEVEQSVASWPQLASSVVMGGGAVGELARKILLGENVESGRFYFDVEHIIGQKIPRAEFIPTQPAPFSMDEAVFTAETYDLSAASERLSPSHDTLQQLIEAGLRAPSGGNNQPWKWVSFDGALFLFHDKSRSESWVDVGDFGAYLALGAAVETVALEAKALGLATKVDWQSNASPAKLFAVLTFQKLDSPLSPFEQDLVQNRGLRHTDRRNLKRGTVPAGLKEEIIASLYGHATAHWATDETDLGKLADIIAASDRLRFLSRQGHHEFYGEIRLTPEEAETKRDGIDLRSANLSPSDLAALQVARSTDVIDFLSQQKLGHGLGKLSRKSVSSASGFVLLTIPAYSNALLGETGRAVIRAWICVNLRRFAFHPMLSPITILNKAALGPTAAEIASGLWPEFEAVKNAFSEIFHLSSAELPIFLAKVADGDVQRPLESLRLPLEKVAVIR